MKVKNKCFAQCRLNELENRLGLSSFPRLYVLLLLVFLICFLFFGGNAYFSQTADIQPGVLISEDMRPGAFAPVGGQRFFSSADRRGMERAECYSSVYVEDGDTLWSIASRYYSVEYRSLKRYMKKIMKLNHMNTTDIYAGTYLVVPYYIPANATDY